MNHVHIYSLPSPGDLLDWGIEPGSPVLEADSLSFEPTGNAIYIYIYIHTHTHTHTPTLNENIFYIISKIGID